MTQRFQWLSYRWRNFCHSGGLLPWASEFAFVGILKTSEQEKLAYVFFTILVCGFCLGIMLFSECISSFKQNDQGLLLHWAPFAFLLIQVYNASSRFVVFLCTLFRRKLEHVAGFTNLRRISACCVRQGCPQPRVLFNYTINWIMCRDLTNLCV